MDIAFAWQRAPEAAEQIRERGDAEQERFPTVEDDAKAPPLRFGEFGEVRYNGRYDRLRHPLGLITPSSVAHVVDIAITAIEVAAARDFEQDCIDGDHRGHHDLAKLFLAIVTVVRAVIGSGHGDYLIAQLPHQSGEHGIIGQLKLIISAAGDLYLIFHKPPPNGVLLDDEMIELLVQHQVGVSISIDGSAAVHDRFRVDLRGRGSYTSAMTQT